MSWKRVVIGLIALLYGIMKLCIGIIQFVIPKSLRAQLSTNKYIGKVIDPNPTMSDAVIDIGLIIFGVYSIVTGLHMLQVIDAAFIHSRTFIYAFYLIMGMSITTFYYILLYTDLPIPKNDKDTVKYTIAGLGGGLVFLLTLFVYILMHHVQDNGIEAVTTTMILCVLSIMIILAAITYITYKSLNAKAKETKSDGKSHLADHIVSLGLLTYEGG